MEKIFSKFNHPIVCAHRGASAYAPENTLSAFQKALDLKTDMVELDVQSSRDNQLFIMHDLEVDRTTDGSGKLAMLTASELASLDAGSWFDEKFKGEPVPQFDAALSLIRGKATFNIEVKCNGLKSSMIEQIIEKIYAAGIENECVLTSFDFSVINEIKQRAPELPAGYIFNVRGFRPHVFTAPVDILSIHFALVNGFFMRQARKHGKKVFVWTVNSPWMMRCMCRLGVHGIITDFPDRLADVVNVWTKSR